MSCVCLSNQQTTNGNYGHMECPHGYGHVVHMYMRCSSNSSESTTKKNSEVHTRAMSLPKHFESTRHIALNLDDDRYIENWVEKQYVFKIIFHKKGMSLSTLIHRGRYDCTSLYRGRYEGTHLDSPKRRTCIGQAL